MMDHMGTWFSVVGPLGWIALFVGIALVIYFVSKAEKDYTNQVPPDEILKKRLARGDISKAEYEALKNTIK